jgi:hypothetical protein
MQHKKFKKKFSFISIICVGYMRLNVILPLIPQKEEKVVENNWDMKVSPI